MKRLSRHVSLTVLLAIIMVQLLLLGLDMVFTYIGELDNVKGNYGAFQAFQFVLLQLPRHVYEILPMASLIGAIVGLGTLASNSELTVMRAAGVSTQRIIWWVMRGALVMVVFGLVLGEFVVPQTYQQAEVIKSRALGSTYQSGLISGYWQREGNELINIALVAPGGELIGVSRYIYSPEGRLSEASFAASGHYVDSVWHLTDLHNTEFAADGSSRLVNIPELVWPVGLTPAFLTVAASSPDQLRIGEIMEFGSYLRKQGLDAAAYELQFWKRVLSPISIFSMVLIACSFIFGPLRSVTLGFRIITGVLVGLVIRYGQDAFGYASLIFHWSPLAAVALPIALCLAAGSYAIYRVR